jgi:hypothetical protein
MVLPFLRASKPSTPWYSVGLVSSFASITPEDSALDASSDRRPCHPIKSHGKVFAIPAEQGEMQARPVSDDTQSQVDGILGKEEQVLVFRYEGSFHAIDNVSRSSLTSTIMKIFWNMLASTISWRSEHVCSMVQDLTY